MKHISIVNLPVILESHIILTYHLWIILDDNIISCVISGIGTELDQIFF